MKKNRTKKVKVNSDFNAILGDWGPQDIADYVDGTTDDVLAGLPFDALSLMAERCKEAGLNDTSGRLSALMDKKPDVRVPAQHLSFPLVRNLTTPPTMTELIEWNVVDILDFATNANYSVLKQCQKQVLEEIIKVCDEEGEPAAGDRAWNALQNNPEDTLVTFGDNTKPDNKGVTVVKPTPTASTVTTSKFSCHSGNILVVSDDSVSIYAGGANNKGGWEEWETRPDLVIGPTSAVYPAHAPAGWKCASFMPKFIEIRWDDYSVPNLPAGFWEACWEDMHEQGIRTVQLQCLGGHGRTGTMVCIFLHLSSPGRFASVDDLIGEVRSIYCSEAVESLSQIKYIAEVTGLPNNGTAKPREHTGVWAEGGYGYYQSPKAGTPTGYGATTNSGVPYSATMTGKDVYMVVDETGIWRIVDEGQGYTLMMKAGSKKFVTSNGIQVDDPSIFKAKIVEARVRHILDKYNDQVLDMFPVAEIERMTQGTRVDLSYHDCRWQVSGHAVSASYGANDLSVYSFTWRHGADIVRSPNDFAITPVMSVVSKIEKEYVNEQAE